MKNVAPKTEKSISGLIKVDEKEIKDHLDIIVRKTVEETLNSLLNAEADAICNASRSQRSADRQDTRAGSYKRKLLTSVGKVELTVPRLRSLPFETEIIRRYQTRQSSVEESLMSPWKHVKTIAAMLKAIHAQENREAAREKAKAVVKKLREKKLEKVAEFVENSVEETLSYMAFPYEHWSKIRTNNGLERIMKEIRRRTRVIGSFPDGDAALMMVGARLRHISTTKWGTRPYLKTCKLYEEGVL